MQMIFNLAAVLLILARFVDAEDQDAANVNVDEPPHLTDSLFNQIVVFNETNQLYTNEKPWFIKFYAPWCGHCKALAPKWDEFHAIHKDKVNVAKVDCTNAESRNLCMRFDIRGYPSLLYFPVDSDLQGKYIKYRGGRNITEFEKWNFDHGYKAFADDSLAIPAYQELKSDGSQPYKKEPQRLVWEITKMVDKFYVGYGLGFVPPLVRYFSLVMLVMTPFAVFACCLIYCDVPEEPEEYEAFKKQGKEGEVEMKHKHNHNHKHSHKSKNTPKED